MLSAEFLDAARRLIAADSVTDRGNLRAVEVVEPLCHAAGLVTRRQTAPDTGERDANLLAGPARVDPGAPPPLLLVTHLDTVEPGPRERWRTDPFTLTIDGDHAYGLGVADVKLDALCKLFAARRLKGVKLHRPFYFLGTYGEEAGLRGARHFTANAPFKPAFVFCGEPCENQPHHAHKGYAMVRVTLTPRSPASTSGAEGREHRFEGKAAHSSTPHLGVNAIDLALAELPSLPRPVLHIEGGNSPNTVPALCTVQTGATGIDLAPMLAEARRLRTVWMDAIARLRPERDTRFKPAEAVGNLTRIRGSDGRVELVMDGRLLPQHDTEELHAAFAAQAVSTSDVVVEVEVLRRSAGMSMAEDAEIVQRTASALRPLGLDPTPVAKPTSTEGGVFTRFGCEALVFGPSVSSGNAHTPNEYAVLSQVERAVDAYEALIRTFCSA